MRMTKDTLSEEDKALFRAYVRQGKTLDKDSALSLGPIKHYELSDYISEPVFAETILSYSPPSFPQKQLAALKKGRIPWEARLDLHGLHLEKAKQSLSEFIQMNAQQNKRCVLIVHGKGGYHGEPPLIKNLVNRWLPQLNELLAYHSARPKDGGAGAVYVLLKRNTCVKGPS